MMATNIQKGVEISALEKLHKRVNDNEQNIKKLEEGKEEVRTCANIVKTTDMRKIEEAVKITEIGVTEETE